MTKPPPVPDTRRPVETQGASSKAEAQGFKPLALPALAAAVRAASKAPPQPRKPTPGELPAALPKEAMFG